MSLRISLFFLPFMQFIYIFQVVQSGFTENIKVILIRGLATICFGLYGVILFMQSGDTLTFLINFIGVGPIVAGIGCLLLIMYSYRKS